MTNNLKPDIIIYKLEKRRIRNLANNSEIVYLRGKLFWAKVIGDPVDNYNKDGKEWVGDLALDSDGIKQVKGIKLNGKAVFNIKDKDDERGEFITFKQKFRTWTDKRTGEEKQSQPINIMDAAGKPWNGDKLGNETVADVKLKIVDYGKSMYPGVYPMAIRILDHVPYASSEFAPLSADDKFFSKAQASEGAYKMTDKEDAAFKATFGGHTADDDLDDDIA